MWRRTTRDRAVILGLVVATIAVLTLDFRTGLIDGLSGATGQVVGVFQAGVRTVVRPIEGLFGSIGDFGSLREENVRLERENRILRGHVERFEDLARENANMRELLQLSDSLELQTIQARVISASLTGLERSAGLDKGPVDGVVEDLPVMAPEGLVGRVVWARGRSSKVMLITDSQSAIGVRIGETGETGIVTGTGETMLRLELVNRAALDRGEVKKGDVVLTSGYQGGIFPPGIPIGQVEKVELASRGTAYTILVQPYARLSRLDIVSVVTSKPPASPPPAREEADEEAS